MPRQSVEQLQVTMSVPRGDDGFWSIILKLDAAGSWGWRDVDQQSNVEARGIRDFIKRLELAGIAERVEQGTTGLDAKAARYRLLERPIETPRIDRQGQIYAEAKTQRLWRTMRMAKTFTAAELRDLAEDENVSISLPMARRFITVLVSVGVVQQAGGTKQTYRLVRDLGPKAPVISITKVVFDPNARAVVGQPALEVPHGQP